MRTSSWPLSRDKLVLPKTERGLSIADRVSNTFVPGEDRGPGHILIPAPVMPNSLCFVYTIMPQDGVHFPDRILGRSPFRVALLNVFAMAFALAGPLRNSTCAYVSCQKPRQRCENQGCPVSQCGFTLPAPD